jgi:hypothetical protein
MRRMRWARHIASTGEMRNAYNILVGKLKGKRHSEELCIGFLRKLVGRYGLDASDISRGLLGCDAV